MFYIFIFESIGTSELMLIGLVALIVFGPRKLPELARTIGKTMAEFRRSTDDFKKTWQQELNLEEAKKSLAMLTDLSDENEVKNENIIRRNSSENENKIVEPSLPEIREISESDFEVNFANEKIDTQSKAEIIKSDKQDWL